MGVEVDPFYKQNLTEWIYEEQKLITYRYLSVTLGVHVNIAKQMLYEFYNDELGKEKQKNKKDGNTSSTGAGIQALFYISGLKSNSSEAGGEGSAFSSTICRDDQVDSVKKGFRRISSVHIYSIQLLQLESDSIMDKLSNALQETSLLKDDNGRSAVEFGPFKVLAATKIKPIPQAPAPSISAPSTKTDVKPKPSEIAKKPDVKQNLFGGSKSKVSEKSTAKKDDEKPQNLNLDKEKHTSSISKPKESSTKKNIGNPNDRLKNMFAAAASKPRKPASKDIIIDSEDEEESSEPARVVKKEPPPKTYGRSNTKNKPKSKEVETTRKRKRVVDILSSSEEEDEEEPRSIKRTNRISSDEEDSLPESPIPKKRAPLIASDSDEDMFKSPKKGQLNFARKNKSPPPEPDKNGKRKVRKTVTKSYIDDDGFTVTKKELEWVDGSESDGEEVKVEKAPNKPDKSTQGIANEKETKNPFSSAAGNKKLAVSAPSPAKKKPASTPSAKKNAGAPKTKQQTLMSFFSKKT